jgi:hypothetical protein
LVDFRSAPANNRTVWARRDLSRCHTFLTGVGLVGLVLALLLCGSALAGQLWLAVLLMISCFALVIVENRYGRGLIERLKLVL